MELHTAAKRNDSDRSDELLDVIPIDVLDHDFCTPYQHACEVQSIDSAEFLADEGADISATDIDGQNGLQLCVSGRGALTENDPWKLGHFLDLGMDVNHLDNSGIPIF